MVKKMLIGFSVLLVTCLLVGCQAKTDGPPQWNTVFDSMDYGYEPVNYDSMTGGAQVWAMEVFKDSLYMCIISADGAQMYRTTDGDTWEAVGEPGLGQNSIGCNDMTVYQDKLYVSLWNTGKQLVDMPGYILRSGDGETFEVVSEFEFGSLSLNPTKFREFDGMLYIQTSFSDGRGQLYRSETGDPDTWEPAGGVKNYHWSRDYETFDDKLYISIFDPEDELIKILRSADGLEWEMVVDDAFQSLDQDGSKNYGGDFVVHAGKLFFTANNVNVDAEGNEISNGARIYTTENGTDWELLMQGGFDDSNNYYIESITSYLGDLYANTANGVTGCEVWKSHTGEPGTWAQVNEDGFGYGLRFGSSSNDTSQAIFNKEWYIAGFDFTEPRLMLVTKMSYP